MDKTSPHPDELVNALEHKKDPRTASCSVASINGGRTNSNKGRTAPLLHDLQFEGFYFGIDKVSRLLHIIEVALHFK